MLYRDEWVIVRDADLHETYIAQVVTNHDEQSYASPLVRIAYCLEYPRQTAILWNDIPNENTPILDGTILRMPFIRRCNAPPGTYASGLEQARERATTQAKAACRYDVLLILERHAHGEYRKRRIYRG